MRGKGDSSTAGRSLDVLSGLGVTGLGFEGNNALDQALTRSGEALVASTARVFVSSGGSAAVSKISVLVPFGMSKFGASSLATDVAMSVANLRSGCSHEPR